MCFALQKATVAEISAVAGGGRLLAALAAAEQSASENLFGPEARVDLDVLWIFIGEVSTPENDRPPGVQLLSGH